ncbi:MAG: lipid-A-disaccharide synthase-related protein [Trueperaceae bacterium]|nr:lipid-A-disaccharide synthase-related protein [Trueperaceae bacterium]
MRTASGTVLLISNGHGEHVVGARIAAALRARAPALRILALPTVGPGEAYADGPAVRIGPSRALPSGGLTVRDPAHLWADLRSGFLDLTWRQARTLRAQRVDAVVSVGDVWAETLGSLPGAPARMAVQTLVSVRMMGGPAPLGLRAFRERFTAPERQLLRRAYRVAYVRDAESARWLRARGVPARFAGNPMMDGLDAAPFALDGEGPRLVLLPGSRGYAPAAVRTMFDVLARLPAVTAVLPWPEGAPALPDPADWRPLPGPEGTRAWRRGRRYVQATARGLAPALAWADIALGTTGTAQEQAAGRGVPVVTFPVPGAIPLGFLRTQRRVLGDALEIVTDGPDAAARAVRRLAVDPAERARRGAIGRARMGPPGGAAAIADDLLRRTYAADDAMGPPGQVAYAPGEEP